MRLSPAASFRRSGNQTLELMVDERHQALGRKPVRLCKGMNNETVDKREEDISLHRRVKILAKLTGLLAFLEQLFEAETNGAIPPPVIEGERLIDDCAKNNAQPQSRGRL